MREAVDPTGHRCIKRLSYIERSQERREERSQLNNYVAEKFEAYIAEISMNFVTLSAFKNNFRLKFDRVMNFFRNFTNLLVPLSAGRCCCMYWPYQLQLPCQPLSKVHRSAECDDLWRRRIQPRRDARCPSCLALSSTQHGVFAVGRKRRCL